MEKQDFLNRVTEIGKCDDDVQRRELLTQLSEEASKDYDAMATLTETNKTLTNDNEALRSANMKLFLRVGETKEGNNGDSTKNNDEAPLTYDNLFNEKGELK